MTAEIEVLNDLIDALLDNNKDETVTVDGQEVSLSDLIEISIINFDTYGHNVVTHTNGANTSATTNKDDLKAAIAALDTNSGTNWEEGLDLAIEEANWYKTNQSDESISVIFLTDGEPTVHAGSYTVSSNYYNEWNEARDEATSIVSDCGATFYGIYTYGSSTTSSNYLKRLVTRAYTGHGYYSNSSTFNAEGESDTNAYTRNYFFDASSTEELVQAFKKIINNINNTVGYGGVEFDDGVTLGVTNTAVTVDGNVNEESLRYTVYSGQTVVYSVEISDEEATFKITGKGTYTSSTNPAVTKSTVTTKIDPNDSSTWIVSTVYSVTVDGVTYMMSPASINTSTGLVEWDLAGLGILENGYTYKLSFDVWPNQYAYDLVADLNNQVKTLEQVKAELIDEKGEEAGTALYNQIVQALKGPDANGEYSILTNWEQKVDYYTVDVKEDEQTGQTTTTYVQQPTKNLDYPDTVELTSAPLPLVKVWDDTLDRDQLLEILYSDYAQYKTTNNPTEYQVKLHVWKADSLAALESLIEQYSSPDENGSYALADAHDYLAKTLGWNGTEYDWDDSLAISPGTMVSLSTAQGMGITIDNSKIKTYDYDDDGVDEQYYIIESGHYYYVTEENVERHFELNTIIYHPMLVDGDLCNVTFKADGTIEEITSLTKVTANNTLKGGINILKRAFDGETEIVATDDIFTVQVTVNNADGTPYLDWDYRIYYGDNNPLKTETVFRSGHYFGTQAAMEASGSSGQVDTVNGGLNVITLDLYIGDTVRIINVPAGVTYSVVETKVNGISLADGAAGNYVFNEIKYEISEGSSNNFVEETGETHAVKGNSSSQATVYNKIPSQKIGVKKIGDSQKDNTLSGVTFKLYKDAELTNQLTKDALGNPIGTNGVLTTGSDGTFEIGTLLAGNYYLVETGLGDNGGYNMLSDAIVITVNSDSNATYDRRVSYTQTGYSAAQSDTNHTDGAGLLIQQLTDDKGLTYYHYTVTVNNSTGVELPHTGGTGTLPYTLGGLMLVIASALMYGFRMRRRERRLN